MRSFEERKAEIFRRSDARIRARKKRRIGALLCCVPMCMCIAFFSVMILPAMMPAGSAGPEKSAAQDSLFCADIVVEIETDGYCRQYTDQHVIAEISDAIRAVTKAKEEAVLGETPAETEDRKQLFDTAVTKDYTVTFTDREGNTKVYVLTDSTLHTEGEEYPLTKEQSDALRLALGITERR